MIPDVILNLQPKIGEQDFPADRQPHDPGQHYEVLATFDHDYLGWHAHVQCWNHDEESPAWEYGLVLCCREGNWVPRLVHDWGTEMPSLAAVGERIDQYLTSPEALRFLLR